jgi:hypothetical protein
MGLVELEKSRDPAPHGRESDLATSTSRHERYSVDWQSRQMQPLYIINRYKYSGIDYTVLKPDVKQFGTPSSGEIKSYIS